MHGKYLPLWVRQINLECFPARSNPQDDIPAMGCNQFNIFRPQRIVFNSPFVHPGKE